MTAPQRIYLQVGPDCTPEELPRVEWSEVSWCADRVFDSDIEYVRADAEPKYQTPKSTITHAGWWFQLRLDKNDPRIEVSKIGTVHPAEAAKEADRD
jgi:hypothetical protein